MNKVVLSMLTMSAVLILSGCSSSGSSRSGHYGGHSAYSSCPSCGPGSYAVKHGHGSASTGNGSSLAKVAGVLLVGGLLYSALDDDDSSSSGHSK